MGKFFSIGYGGLRSVNSLAWSCFGLTGVGGATENAFLESAGNKVQLMIDFPANEWHHDTINRAFAVFFGRRVIDRFRWNVVRNQTAFAAAANF